jgi:hypothetical protein
MRLWILFRRSKCAARLPVVGMVIAFLVALAACGGNAQPVVVTIEPTETFTAGPVPTAVITVASAANVTSTPRPAGSLTTPTPGPSPTSPLAPTLSPAPATFTATFAPTLARLSIDYFTTDSESARPGDNITLFWSVRGADRARIFRLDENEERIYRWDVEAEGKITVSTRTSDREVARFLLTAEVDGATIEETLLIPLQCTELWFFDPAPAACPAEPPQFSNQVEQTFERGRMIWIESQNRIYVIFEDGNSPAWAQYPDTYSEGLSEPEDAQLPPAGLERPVRGFGLVWSDNPRVQDRLGWATTPEVPYEGMYQADAAEASVATLYLRMRDGNILALDAQATTWELLASSGAASDAASQ